MSGARPCGHKTYRLIGIAYASHSTTSICVGVGLMAVDMMVGKKQPKPVKEAPPAEVAETAPPPPAEPAPETK